jgi:hypothetical protein
LPEPIERGDGAATSRKEDPALAPTGCDLAP